MAQNLLLPAVPQFSTPKAALALLILGIVSFTLSWEFNSHAPPPLVSSAGIPPEQWGPYNLDPPQEHIAASALHHNDTHSYSSTIGPRGRLDALEVPHPNGEVAPTTRTAILAACRQILGDDDNGLEIPPKSVLSHVWRKQDGDPLEVRVLTWETAVVGTEECRREVEPLLKSYAVCDGMAGMTEEQWESKAWVRDNIECTVGNGWSYTQGGNVKFELNWV